MHWAQKLTGNNFDKVPFNFSNSIIQLNTTKKRDEANMLFVIQNVYLFAVPLCAFYCCVISMLEHVMCRQKPQKITKLLL